MRRRPDTERARRWETAIREAARSGGSVREFCRPRNLLSQFYWWRHRLKQTRPLGPAEKRRVNSRRVSFALVRDEPGTTDAGLGLVLGYERRLRISRGVDEAALRQGQLSDLTPSMVMLAYLRPLYDLDREAHEPS